MKVLVAGASGSIGHHVVHLLREQGHRIRALTRRRSSTLDCDQLVADATHDGALAGACDDIEVVVSALGATLGFDLTERSSYADVDLLGNLALLAEARRAGVGRMIQVGALPAAGTIHTRYVRAHQALADALAASSLTTTVVQPASVFSAFDELLEAAKHGRVWLVGDGSGRSNPIHPRDVAQRIVEHLEQGPETVPIGGPEVLTRRQIAERAFVALGKTPRIVRAPAPALRWAATLTGRVQPRLSELLELAVAVSTHDAIAPRAGTRTLSEYFAAALAANRPR